MMVALLDHHYLQHHLRYQLMMGAAGAVVYPLCHLWRSPLQQRTHILVSEGVEPISTVVEMDRDPSVVGTPCSDANTSVLYEIPPKARREDPLFAPDMRKVEETRIGTAPI